MANGTKSNVAQTAEKVQRLSCQSSVTIKLLTFGNYSELGML